MAKIKPETRIEHQLDDIITVLESGGGGGGASLPDVTVADNGKVLGVVEGAWDKTDAPSGAEKFIVTLTPTNPDMSGNMDKTPKEISDANDAGNEIWFSISIGGSQVMLRATVIESIEDDYPSFVGYAVTALNEIPILAVIATVTNQSQYFVQSYPLQSL